MSNKQHIKIEILSRHYQVEHTFFQQLDAIGLIETEWVEDQLCVDEQQISRLDKLIRLHQDLEINPQGLDVVLNLLNKIEQLEQSLTAVQNRLSLFE